MIIYLDGQPPRDLTTISFADITSVPVVGFPMTEDGDPTIEFGGDLTPVEAQRVRARAMATANEAILQDKAFQAFQANKAWLGRSVAPTNAQVLAQVDRLTREWNGLARLYFGITDDISDV